MKLKNLKTFEQYDNQIKPPFIIDFLMSSNQLIKDVLKKLHDMGYRWHNHFYTMDVVTTDIVDNTNPHKPNKIRTYGRRYLIVGPFGELKKQIGHNDDLNKTLIDLPVIKPEDFLKTF